MTDNQLVSIVIPVYNGANFLREAIDSALAQTWPHVEVLVINDGSTDDGETERIARSYGERIRYIAKKNGGVASALNLGILEMRGDYLSWLSHDDVYYPDKVAAQMAEMAKHDRDVILYADYDEIDVLGRRIGSCCSSPLSPVQFRRMLVGRGPVHGCSTLVPRSCFELCGVFDESLRTSQDYDLWFRLSRHYEFVHLPKILIGSRVHGEQGSRTMNRTRIEEGNRLFIRMLEKLVAEAGNTPGDDFVAFLGDVSLALCSSGYGEAARFAARCHGGMCQIPQWLVIRLKLACCLARQGCRQWLRRSLGKERS